MLGHQHLIRRLTIVTVVLFLASCARPAGQEPSPASQTPLVWPPAPAKPRLQFLRTFARPQDLGINGGFFKRLGELFAGGSEASALIRPMDVVATPGGVLYVADPGANGVHRFDAAKGRYKLIRRRGREPLPSPVGLTRGSRGEVYVTDSLLAQIFVITPESQVATPMALQTTLQQPTALAIDPEAKRLYVVDTGAHQVNIFGLDGTLRTTFGRRGTGNGEFNYPTAIWNDRAGRLFVTDALNFRIQIFDAEGKFLGKIGKLGDATGDFARPKGVAADRFGHIYVVDALFHAVQIFDLSGGFLLSFGSQGRGPGEFWLPTGIFIGAHDTIYVADSHNQRVQVFRYIGG